MMINENMRVRMLAATAAIMLGHPYAQGQTNNLMPEAEAKNIIDEINASFASLNQVVLVGHEPFLSGLMSTLLIGGEGLTIDLKKGALCKLSAEKLALGKCAVLEWLLTANQMSRLGKGKQKLKEAD